MVKMEHRALRFRCSKLAEKKRESVFLAMIVCWLQLIAAPRLLGSNWTCLNLTVMFLDVPSYSIVLSRIWISFTNDRCNIFKSFHQVQLPQNGTFGIWGFCHDYTTLWPAGLLCSFHMETEIGAFHFSTRWAMACLDRDVIKAINS